MSRLSFRVYGLPGAQGSKRHVGGGRMIESSKKVGPWRQDVTNAAVEAALTTNHEPFAGPVKARIIFYLPRPKSHYRTGANAHELKPSAPVHVQTTPDIDKLMRSTCDALTIAGVWRDDAQLVAHWAEKRYAAQPGADIELCPMAVTV